MKKLIWAAIGIGVVAIAALAIVTWQSNPPPQAETTVPSTETPAPSVNPPPPSSTLPARVHPPERAVQNHLVVKSAVEPANAPTEGVPTPPVAQAATKAKPTFSPAINQALQTVLTPQADYADKQAAWKQLAESGKLDQAIKELEHQTGEDPSDAESLAVLGQAYLNKCGTIKDVREQGILAMKADQAFEAALNHDPKNWEARFTRAVAMSYWPPELNKSQEVMENFVTLVEQQEAQPTRPEYAQTYVWLGDQYLKAGRSDLARDTWQRGARLYPNDGALPKRLAGQP